MWEQPHPYFPSWVYTYYKSAPPVTCQHGMEGLGDKSKHHRGKRTTESRYNLFAIWSNKDQFRK